MIDTTALTGIDVGGRVIILKDLETELNQGGVATPHGIAIAGPSSTTTPDPLPVPGGPPPACSAGSKLFMYDAQHVLADLPPEAAAIVAAYTV